MHCRRDSILSFHSFLYIADIDYTALSVSMPFPAGTSEGDADSTQCVDISIIDNMAFEKNETFFVIISSEPEVILFDPNGTVVIVDDEGISDMQQGSRMVLVRE